MFHFLETAIFTWLATAQLSPEEYRALQPYAKNDQGDLTSAQAKALAQVVKEEFE